MGESNECRVLKNHINDITQETLKYVGDYHDPVQNDCTAES